MESSKSPINLITHNAIEQSLAVAIAELKNHIMKEGDKPESTVDEQLALLEQLSKFGFGQCLIKNRGITGQWTRHMVLYPKWRKETPEVARSLTPLNKWLLEKSPVILATQERFIFFQKLLQEHLGNGVTAASIPCGLMDDLITLELSGIENVKFVGIDLDSAALEDAKENAKKFNLEDGCSFIQSDVWQLNISNEFEMITSNGLNFYEPSDEKVVQLYKKFYNALKPNGILITSFLTPPPALSQESPWDMANIDSADLKLQKVIMSTILQVRFQAYRTEAETIRQLKAAGFVDINIVYDKARIFPTVYCFK